VSQQPKNKNAFFKQSGRTEESQLWKHDSAMPKDQFDAWHALEGQGDYWPDGKGAGKLGLDANGESMHLTWKIGTQSIDFLKKYPNEPVLLNLYFKSPHSVVSPDLLYADLYKNSGTFPHHENHGTAYNKFLPDVQRAKSRCSNTTSEGRMKARAKLVYGVDVTMGRIIQELKAQKRMENTVIVFTSDNGYALGAYGCTGKDNLQDHFARVPFTVYDPRVAASQRGRWLKKPVMTLDVGPTLLEYAGVDIPESMQGLSIVDVLNGEKDLERESIFQENYFTGYNYIPTEWIENNDEKKKTENGSWRARGVRTEKYHYIRFYGVNPIQEALYITEKDSLEITNFIDDPAYADVKAKMIKLYDEWVKTSQDARIDSACAGRHDCPVGG